MDSIKILFSIIGNIFAYILEFIFFLLIRIYFDIKIIGQYGSIFSFLMIFSFILALGLATTYLKTIAKVDNVDDKARCNGTFLFFRLFQFSIYILIIFLFSQIIPSYNAESVVFYFFFFGSLLGSAVIQIFEFFFISQKKIFKKSVLLIISLSLKISLLIILISIYEATIWLLAYIYFISNLVLFIMGLIFLKGIQFKKPTSDYIKKFLKNTYPLFITTSLLTIVNNIDVLMVNAWFSVEVVANYFTAKQILEFFLLISTSISFILLYIFSNNTSLGNNDKNLQFIKKIHKFLNLFVVPLTFLIILYSPELIVLIFGERYKLTGFVLSIFSFNLIILSVDLANRIQLIAQNEVKFYAEIMIFQNLISIILLFFFISPAFLNMGAIGAAYSLIIAWTMTQIITRPIIYKKFGLGFYWGVFRNMVIMFGVSVLQVYININIYYTIYFIPFFIIFDFFLYFLINYLLKGFTKEDIKFIFTVINLGNIKRAIFSELKKNNF